MKKLRSLLSVDTKKPIIYSSISKSLIALALVLVWDRFVNTNSIMPMGLVSTGFFAAGAWFILWAWFQYLSLDGMKILPKIKEDNSHKRFSFDDIINTNSEAFENLDDDELTAVKFCSDLIVAVIFLVPSIIASFI